MSIMQLVMTSTLGGAPTPPAGPIMSLVADSYSGSGTTWPDGSGYGHPGTLVNGPTFTNTSPKYFTFNRSNTQFVQGPDLGNLSTWTIESWFRLTEPLSNTEATALITTTYENGAGTLYNVINYTLCNYVEGMQSGGNDHLTVGFYDGNWRTTAGFVPTVGNWYHVVGTYDGITLKQWVNGTLDTQRSVASSTISNGGPVRVARRWDGYSTDSQQFFPGDVATAKIYNGVLSDAEIFNAWNGSRATYGL